MKTFTRFVSEITETKLLPSGVEVLPPEEPNGYQLALHSILARHGYRKTAFTHEDGHSYRTYHHPADSRFTVHTSTPDRGKTQKFVIKSSDPHHPLKKGSGSDALDQELQKRHGWEFDPDRHSRRQQG